MELKKSNLLKIYLLVPVLFAVALWDNFFNGGGLKSVLPASPNQIFWFSIIFVQPHIMASLFSFLDKPYLEAYRKQLLWWIPLAFALPWLLIYTVGREKTEIFIILWTTWHVINQQLGLTSMMLKNKSLTFEAWRWSFLIIFTNRLLLSLAPQTYTSTPAYKLFYILLIVTNVLTFIELILNSKSSLQGKLYLTANFCLGLTAAFYNFNGYEFFSVLIFRLIHDLTGFYFYMVHDHARAQEKKSNWLYQVGQTIKIPALWWCPILGILLAFPLTNYQEINWVGNIMTGFIFLHYLTEATIWKSGSLHRQQLKITD